MNIYRPAFENNFPPFSPHGGSFFQEKQTKTDMELKNLNSYYRYTQNENGLHEPEYEPSVHQQLGRSDYGVKIESKNSRNGNQYSRNADYLKNSGWNNFRNNVPATTNNHMNYYNEREMRKLGEPVVTKTEDVTTLNKEGYDSPNRGQNIPFLL